MVRASLPPGFRFHPTDVELILYYLKRKIMGRKFTYEAIAEVNIYKHSPWDLPDKSCLKSKDLEWFFFCPRERKYASGVRVKRATENGYWKTTGKDRNITCNGKTVGTIKTLIFHLGHAPQGERTDWVIHEYRILDDQLAKDGVQDNYVICKVFKKNGLGPNNGAQYGAPFSEADWADDDEDVNQNCSISLAAEGSFSAGLMQNEEQSLPLGSALSGFGNGSPHILEGGPSSSAIVPTTVVAEDKTADGFACLLASFLDEDMPLSNENKLDQGDPSEHGRNKLASSSEGLDLYNGLHDLDSWTTMNEGGFEFSEMQNTDNCLNSMLPKDNSTYIELDDLLPSLDCSDGVAGTPLSSLWQAPASYSHDNMQQLYSGTSITGIDQYTSYTNELAVPPYNSEGDIFLDGLQMMDHQLYQGDNSEFPFSQSEAVYSPHNMMERGSDLENYYSRIMEWIPGELGSATAVAFGGSSIHIKAEVTGVCTDEALSLMMEGSNTSWCCCYFLLTKYTYSLMLLNLVQVFSALIMVWSYHYKHLNENFTHKVHLLLCLKLHLHVLLSY